jgi:exopolyphosphatase/guanosine-5'-triphosphate,3'-diphosphate pyrophosphatase
MRAAAIDIGTNSVLLLIAEQRGDDLVAVVERATITRLGQGVDKERALAPEAVERTLACLTRYAEDMRRAGIDRAAAVGTSAMRDARGGDAFRARAAEILGVEPRVVSGEEEARLTFAGALTGLGLEPGPVTVFDIGGGSTEIIHGDTGGSVGAAVSLDVGSVRLTERHVKNDPPATSELDAIRADARSALGGAFVTQRNGQDASAAPSTSSPHASNRLVGVAGTVTTLAALVLGVAPYDGARVHGARLSKDDVAHAAARLAGLSLSDRRALPALDPARADVIVAGSILMDELLAWAAARELIVSDRGVRWGLAQDLLRGAGGV